MNLCEQLQHCLRSRACLVGLGNTALGDDAFGVRLAESLAARSATRSAGFQPAVSQASSLHNPDLPCVLIAGTAPEQFLGRAGEGAFDHIIFLDAVDFGGPPGATVFLNADQIAARYPQISTHKLSLGLLAKTIEANGDTKAWLLGVQPQSLKPNQPLTPEIQTTLDLLHQLIMECGDLSPLSPSATCRAPQPEGLLENSLPPPSPQPEGLPDSSRRSQTSGNVRENSRTLKGCQNSQPHAPNPNEVLA